MYEAFPCHGLNEEKEYKGGEGLNHFPFLKGKMKYCAIESH